MSNLFRPATVKLGITERIGGTRFVTRIHPCYQPSPPKGMYLIVSPRICPK